MRKIVLTLAAALLLLPTVQAEAAWRATATTFTVYYCGAPARMDRLGEVLRWKTSGYHIVWRVTLETALDVMLIPSSAQCGGGTRTEAKWTMDRSLGEALIIPYLDARGIETEGLTAAQLANAFSAEFKLDLIQWETEYNAWQAEQAAPVPVAVDELEEP
jgi:hypothetical protein